MPDPFQPSEYLQVAKELAAQSQSEAHLRAAVSRASLGKDACTN